MDGVKAEFDKRVEDGTTSLRNVGWFRIDIEKNPEVAPLVGDNLSVTIMESKSGKQTKKVRNTLHRETEEEI